MSLSELIPQLSALQANQAEGSRMVWKVLYADRQQPLLVPVDIRLARLSIAFFMRNPLLRCWGNLLLTADHWLPRAQLLPTVKFDNFPHGSMFGASHAGGVALFCGFPGPLQKLTVYCPDPAGGLGRVAKVALQSSANAAISLEANWLGRLSHTPAIARFLPRLLRNDTLPCGHRYFSMLSLPEGVSSRHFGELHYQFLSVLAEHQLVFERWNTSQAYTRLQARTQAVLPLLDADLRCLLLDTLAEIELAIGNARLPTCMLHGDFAPWNLRESQGRIFAFDWEYAETSGNPLQDFLHFHLIQRALQRWPLHAGSMSALLGKAAAYADRQFGHDSGVAAASAALSLYYLLDIMTFYIEVSGHMDYKHPVLGTYARLLRQRAQWLPQRHPPAPAIGQATSQAPPPGITAKAGNQDIFAQMIRTFEQAGMPYCILAGYDELPQGIPSDIDFMLPADWNSRLPGLISTIASATGARLVQHLQHETTAGYFVLARRNGAAITYLHPDSSTDYRRNGRLWLRAESVLQNRRRHAHGFWIPSAADAFSYYLIKKLDKGNLNAAQAMQLAARYAEDSRSCRERLHLLLPPAQAQLLETALTRGTAFDAAPWRAIDACLPALRRALRSHAPPLRWRDRWSDRMADVRRLWLRCRQPTGLRIVLLGPDGSGKSTVIAALTQQLSQAFRAVEYRHLFPGSLADTASRPVTDPHAQPLRGRVGSLAKLLHFWSRYQLGNLLWLYPRQVRSTLVVFDRYYQDILADPARYRYGASLALASRLGRWLPQPDLVFILDAPAELLQSRKQEVPLAESARQRAAYRALAGEFRHARIIDSSQPVAQVVAEVLDQTLVFLEQRTTRRLHFSPSTQRPHLCKT